MCYGGEGVYINPAMGHTVCNYSAWLARKNPRRATKSKIHRVLRILFASFPHEVAPETATSPSLIHEQKGSFPKLNLSKQHRQHVFSVAKASRQNAAPLELPQKPVVLSCPL